MLGKHCLSFWSSTQKVVATSSGESEYYAIVRASSEALGVRALCADAGMAVDLVGKMDSTAASGMAMRRGLGKVKHMSVQYLWL